MIFYGRGVVMIRRDHGSPASAAWNDDDDIPLMRVPFLVVQPAARPREIEIRFPAKWQFTRQSFIHHAVGLDDLAIIVQQIISEHFQIAMMMTKMFLGDRIADDVGIVLVDVLALG